jgi:hypothetical protein
MRTKPKPGHVTWIKLAEITGIPDSTLQDISKRDYFPYETPPRLGLALLGIIRYLREKAEKKNPYFTSMAQCSAFTCIAQPVLQAAKHFGCLAFRGSRVYLFPLMRFLSAQDESWFALVKAGAEAKLAHLASCLKLERRKLAKETRDLVPRAEVECEMRAVLFAFRERFSALASEAAALCNPSDPEFARLALEEWVRGFEVFARGMEAELDAALDPDAAL